MTVERIPVSDEHVMVVDGHLGGYVEGGDKDCIYEELWAWLAQDAYDRDDVLLLDVGCGDGIAIDAFRRHGLNAWGVDGMNIEHPHVLRHDFTTGLYGHFNDTRFLGELIGTIWCCEFLEHIEERFLPNVMETMRQAHTVAITHAVPGQAGWHHVNLQGDHYWEGAFAAHGFRFDLDATEHARHLAGLNGRSTNYFRDTGMIFRRNEPLETTACREFSLALGSTVNLNELLSLTITDV